MTDKHIPTRRTGENRPLRVLHVLAYSEPRLNGYALRSRYIIHWQRDQGDLEPFVATSPMYPHVLGPDDEVREGVTYYRIAHPVQTRGGAPAERLIRRICRRKYAPKTPPAETTPTPRARAKAGSPQWLMQLPGKVARRAAVTAKQGVRLLRRLLRPYVNPFEQKVLAKRFERELIRIGQEVKPDVIHAHSPYRCGAPALAAARKLGAAMVYEVRGLWEDSGVVSGYMTPGDAEYNRWREQEEAVMRRADAVVAIGSNLAEDLIARGVDRERVFISYNAVDLEAFAPLTDAERAEARRDPDVAAAAERLTGVTLGYVGSIRELEGVDDLVRGFAELAQTRDDCSLLIVGGAGAELEALRALAERLGVAERAVFTGRVPHEKVRLFYDLIDVFVVSRRAARVTELVTPLKPLEAMAMGQALVVSDLPALAEIVEHEKTGLSYRAGDPADLAAQCARLIDQPDLRRRVAQAALQWVRENRTWSHTLRELYLAYDKARKNNAGRT